MKKKLSLKEMFQGKIIKFGIRKIIPAAGWEKQLSKINVRLINRMPASALKDDAPTIAIITPPFSNRLCMMGEIPCRQMMENIFKNNLFLILANSLSIPAVFKNIAANTGITIAASKYDAHYLRSLLKSLIREKFQETIYAHGVVLEAKGKGILITGASGIGKTMAALQAVTKDGCWVADDVVVIKKNKNGELIAAGHKKIQNYIHTEATGIIAVDNLLKPDQIKMNTKLAAVVNVERTGIKDIRIKGEQKILGVKLIYFHVKIPATGYFDENLLKKVLEQLSKENQ